MGLLLLWHSGVEGLAPGMRGVSLLRGRKPFSLSSNTSPDVERAASYLLGLGKKEAPLREPEVAELMVEDISADIDPPEKEGGSLIRRAAWGAAELFMANERKLKRLRPVEEITTSAPSALGVLSETAVKGAETAAEVFMANERSLQRLRPVEDIKAVAVGGGAAAPAATTSRSVPSDVSRAADLIMGRGTAPTRFSLVATARALGSAAAFAATDVKLRALFAARGIAFPSSLAGMVGIFAGLLTLDIVSPRSERLPCWGPWRGCRLEGG